uniref:Allograft inflammatory factor 1 n=1 Tax=Sus scrofa TaxID=9823 RepID=A0A480G001_PIG
MDFCLKASSLEDRSSSLLYLGSSRNCLLISLSLSSCWAFSSPKAFPPCKSRVWLIAQPMLVEMLEETDQAATSLSAGSPLPAAAWRPSSQTSPFAPFPPPLSPRPHFPIGFC